MIDDILTCYASAQLMVANDTQNRTRFRRISSATVGATRLYLAITVFNSLLILLMLAEAIRTRGWKGLVDFDYMDLRNQEAKGLQRLRIIKDHRGCHGKRVKTVAFKIGRIRVVHRGPHLVFSGLGKLGKSRESL